MVFLGIYFSFDIIGQISTDTIVGIRGHAVTVLQSNIDLEMKTVSQFMVLFGYSTDRS